MAKETILVVEDEEDILELVRYNLNKEGYRVTGVLSGEEGLRLAKSHPPDLIILDLMLPGMEGLTVCRELKQDLRTREVPIIILTAKGEEADIVAGLELGADDYVTKPFSPRVLLARVRAVLRRLRAEKVGESESLEIHGMVIHPGRHEVLVEGRGVDLTVTEFRLLAFLARRPGWVFTRAQIVQGVQGEDYAVSERAVDVQIVGLRKKLGSAGQYIETVRGVGYRLKE
jgi:two-component system alkaline phosphatase synthesis response regulator PhoP